MANRKTRKKIPDSVQAQILIESKRRCCLCFHFSKDLEIKTGQIAHLNKKNHDHRVENLAFLCFKHHDDYDSTRSQSKGITRLEVIHAKQSLIEELSSISQQSIKITISVEGDFHSLTSSEREQLLSNAISKVEMKGEVVVVDIEPGSIKYTIRISGEDALNLLKSYNSHLLAGSGIKNISIAPEIKEKGLRFFDQYNDLCHGFSKSNAIDVVLRPDSVQSLFTKKSLDPALEQVRVYLKKVSFKHSVLVLAVGSPKDMGIVGAFPFSNEVIRYSRGENPLNVLEQFLDMYGLSMDFSVQSKKIWVNERIDTPNIRPNVSDITEFTSRRVRECTDENLTMICVFEKPRVLSNTLFVSLMFVVLKDKYHSALNNIGINPRYKETAYFCITFN